MPSPSELAELSATFAANRARGRVALTAQPSGPPRAVVEEGALRVRFPGACAGAPEAVLVNTGGGMAGGDRFAVDLALGAGARLAVTTAAAEKVYRSLGACARVEVTASLGEDAELAWLPQETILFDRARLDRAITVTLAASARLLLAETTVFGRTAMGESVADGAFADRWRVSRSGRLVFAENFRLDGAVSRRLGEAAVAGGRQALGTVLMTPAAQVPRAVRETAGAFAGEVGISAWGGIALARLAAPDGAALRRDLVLLLTALGHRALPRLFLH